MATTDSEHEPVDSDVMICDWLQRFRRASPLHFKISIGCKVLKQRLETAEFSESPPSAIRYFGKMVKIYFS